MRAIPALLVFVVACGGPATPAELPSTRGAYNESLVRSSNEQLVLNLVRLRYLHAPQFLEVTAVTSQSSLTQSSSAGIGLNFGNNLSSDPNASLRPDYVVPNIGGSVSTSQRPTVSYSPLSGEAFNQRMVHPIQPRTILSLAQVGWRIDRLLACCVARVNDVPAPVIASRDPRYGGERFHRIAEVLYALQERGALTVDEVRVGTAVELRLTLSDTDATGDLTSEARELLGLVEGRETYRVAAGHRPEAVGGPSDTIVLRGRSLLGALFYLSHGVEVEDADRRARSLDFTDADGADVEVGPRVDGALLAIRTSADEPERAYVRTQYRDRWYRVDDADLESKQILLLLQVLFSALSADDDRAPVLTIPVGR